MAAVRASPLALLCEDSAWPTTTTKARPLGPERSCCFRRPQAQHNRYRIRARMSCVTSTRVPAESADQSESWSESCADRAQPAPLAHHTTLLGTATHIMLPLLHPTLATSSDGPPALVAHSPCRASPALFGRDAVKARDALLGQCPLGQPRGVRRRGYSPGHRPRDAHSVETTPDV